MRVGITEDRTAAFFDVDLTSHFSVTLVSNYQSLRWRKLRYAVRTHFTDVRACVRVCVMFQLVYFGAFAKLREATVSFVMSVRPPARMEQLGCQWKGFS
jgi:hypothetical protein